MLWPNATPVLLFVFCPPIYHMPQQTLAVATALNDPWKHGGMYKALYGDEVEERNAKSYRHLYDDEEEKRYHTPTRHHDDDGTRSHVRRRR